MSFKALFIDVDDTLLKMKGKKGNPQDTGSLISVLVDAGVELGGLSREESTCRVSWVKQHISWWSWDHFIDKLGLGHDLFWDFAYTKESCYLGETEEGLPISMKQLVDQGLTLFVTSNNPESGIRHKLRLAGFSASDIDTLFTGIFGATELQSTKWETRYWQLAIEASGFLPHEIAVVGDNIRDDYEVPQASGLPFTFLIDQKSKHRTSGSLRSVSGIKEIIIFFDDLVHKV